MERQKGSFPLGNSKISDGFISERATNSYNFDLAVNRMRIAGSILVLLIASQLLGTFLEWVELTMQPLSLPDPSLRQLFPSNLSIPTTLWEEDSLTINAFRSGVCRVPSARCPSSLPASFSISMVLCSILLRKSRPGRPVTRPT